MRKTRSRRRTSLRRRPASPSAWSSFPCRAVRKSDVRWTRAWSSSRVTLQLFTSASPWRHPDQIGRGRVKSEDPEEGKNESLFKIRPIFFWGVVLQGAVLSESERRVARKTGHHSSSPS